MRQPLRVRIVKMRAVPVGPEWIPLSARSRRAPGYRLSAISYQSVVNRTWRTAAGSWLAAYGQELAADS
jgi:hypothetical protein